MLWSRFILIFMLALVSARPSPELSLEDIEKELEQLTVKDNDASDSAKSKSDEAAPAMEDAAKKTEIAVKDTEQKKDTTMETKADTDTKSTDTHADPVAEVPKGPAKIDFKDSSAYRRLLELKDTPAYRRLMASISAKERPLIVPKPHFPEAPYRRTYASMSAKEQPPFIPKQHFPEAPYRRTYDYRKYDDTPILPKSYFPERRTFDDFNVNRRRFLPNSDPIERLRELSSAGHADFDGYRRGFLSNTDAHESTRRLPSEITKTERTSISSGSWVPGSEPVKVPERIPAPFNQDADVRSYNDVRMQLNDKDTEDLIHGKDGLTDAEKRKRYLMELLAEKIKSKVAEAQKRGLKVPDKIMDFLWDYESRRSTVPETDKTHFSH